MDNTEHLLRRLFETIIPAMLDQVDVTDLDVSPEDIPSGEIVSFLLSKPARYEISNGLVTSFFNDLLLPHTTEGPNGA